MVHTKEYSFQYLSCTHLVLFVITYSSEPQNVVTEKYYLKLVEQLAMLRLLFVAVLFVLFDSFMYQGMTTSTAPICVTLIEVIILIIIARRSGISELDQILDRVFNSKLLKSDD